MSNCCPCLLMGWDFRCPHHHPGHGTAPPAGYQPSPRWICQHWLLAPEQCPGTPVLHWVGVTAKWQLETLLLLLCVHVRLAIPGQFLRVCCHKYWLSQQSLCLVCSRTSSDGILMASKRPGKFCCGLLVLPPGRRGQDCCTRLKCLCVRIRACAASLLFVGLGQQLKNLIPSTANTRYQLMLLLCGLHPQLTPSPNFITV